MLGHHVFAATAASALLASVLVRILVGEPYTGATFLLLAACGVSLLPFVPREVASPVLRLAVAPGLAIAAYSILLTSVSIVGVPLTETSITLAVAVLVCVCAGASLLTGGSSGDPAPRWEFRKELFAAAALAVIVAFSLASSWDIVYPLQARGTDVGHYLLYADEVAVQQGLLIDDPYAGEEGRVFADPAAVGATYGSFLILDGISSWALGAGLVIVSALSVLSVYVAAGALWGIGPGLVAAAAYGVAPIRLDTMYWHGLGTTLALLFFPLVVLALGLMFRGRHDWRTCGLLAVALVGIAVSHSTSAIIAASVVVMALLLDLGRCLLVSRPRREVLRTWWRDGIARPVLASAAVACALGMGMNVHLGAQAADLGRPVSYRFLGPDWLDRAAVAGYYSWAFLVVAAIALVIALSSRRCRSDPALIAVLALALGCVVVSQLWRVEFPFEYRRVVYPLGIALVLVMGVAFTRFRPGVAWIAVWILAFLYVAQLSIGLRLPQRVVAGAGPTSPAVSGLRLFRLQLDSGEVPDTDLIVTDSCLHFAVPYFVRRPTIPAFGERQVGFEDRLPLARKAATILGGGRRGRTLAAELGVRYAVVDPRCTPGLVARLGGSVVLENGELQVVQLPDAA